ncbi:MAG: hypothetical protein ACRDGR_07340, partial [bacterium]
AALLTVVGLVAEARTGRCPRWLPVVLVAGPLVRYENAALSVPAMLLLAWRGHGRVATLSGVALAAGIGAFSAWLHAQGLGWLPTSVVAKSPPIAEGTVVSFLRNVSIGFAERQAVPLALLGLASLAVAVDPLRPPPERGLGAWGASVAVAHFLAGRFGWYHRYEIYAWAALLSSNTILHGRLLAGVLLRRRAAGLAMLAAALFVLAFPYWHALYTLPAASNNIHEQQHQMHRFAVAYWKAPVAVNDLGWVSYRNDEYVLDLWGLASRRALEERRSNDPGDWMTELCASRNVKLAMIYENWLAGVPSAWIPLADLRLSRNRTSVARSSMTFFALDEDARDRAIPLLEAFEADLPRGVKLRWREGWRASAEP